MKIGKRKLKMSSGEIRTFRSQAARNRFEKVAQAVKHGWTPPSNPNPGSKYIKQQRNRQRKTKSCK